MADLPGSGRSDDSPHELVAIPRLAESIGVTARVLRYWAEQGLISPTREHGKLRYSPRDRAIARLAKRLLDAGASVDGLLMLRRISEQDVRLAASGGEEDLLQIALRILYQRKAFREVAGVDEERFAEGDLPTSRPPPGAKHRRPRPHPHPSER